MRTRSFRIVLLAALLLLSGFVAAGAQTPAPEQGQDQAPKPLLTILLTGDSFGEWLPCPS